MLEIHQEMDGWMPKWFTDSSILAGVLYLESMWFSVPCKEGEKAPPWLRLFFCDQEITERLKASVCHFHYTHVHIYVHAHTYTYIYTHTHTQMNTDTERLLSASEMQFLATAFWEQIQILVWKGYCRVFLKSGFRYQLDLLGRSIPAWREMAGLHSDSQGWSILAARNDHGIQTFVGVKDFTLIHGYSLR